jgi:hypothetical protein
MSIAEWFQSGLGKGKTSLLLRFRAALVAFYVTSLVTAVVLISLWTQSEVYTAANQELGLLVDMVKSLRAYVAEDVRPFLLERVSFMPQLFPQP